MSWNVAEKYALDMSGALDNAPKLAQLANDIAVLRAGDKPMPRLVFPEGILSFSSWPDLAYANLQIVAEGECRLRYTGSGDGVVFDGSLRNPAAQEPGIDNLTFTGFDIDAGPSGVPLWFKGIHRSNLGARVLVYRGGTTMRAAIQMSFCVVTKIRPVVSSPRKTPIVGLWIDTWPGKANLQTTACAIDTPCLEGCSIGMQMQSAGSCITYGGTVENCGVAVGLDNAGHNRFIAVDMEGNGQDVQATGNAKGNGFEGCGNDGNLNTNFGWFSSNWACK